MRSHCGGNYVDGITGIPPRGREITETLILLGLVLVIVLAGLGLALYVLCIAVAVLLVLWLIGFVVGRDEGAGNHRFYRC